MLLLGYLFLYEFLPETVDELSFLFLFLLGIRGGKFGNVETLWLSCRLLFLLGFGRFGAKCNFKSVFVLLLSLFGRKHLRVLRGTVRLDIRLYILEVCAVLIMDEIILLVFCLANFLLLLVSRGCYLLLR